MPLIQINAEFSRLVAVLGRIADALDRAYPPRRKPLSEEPSGELISVTNEELLEWEEEELRQRSQGEPGGS